MGKRLLVIGVFSLCLVGLVAADVDAGCSVQYGKLVCKSICRRLAEWAQEM